MKSDFLSSGAQSKQRRTRTRPSNLFVQRLAFGGCRLLAENTCNEQQKMIKYYHLVACIAASRLPTLTMTAKWTLPLPRSISYRTLDEPQPSAPLAAVETHRHTLQPLGLGRVSFAVRAGARKLRGVANSVGLSSASELRVHFGLGDDAKADLEIRWPSGTVQTLGVTPVSSLGN